MESRIDAPVGLEEGEGYCKISDEVLGYLKATGFTAPDGPYGQEPHLPKNLSALTANQIIDLQSTLAEWYDCISSHVTLLRVLRTDAERKAQLVSAIVRRSTTGNKDERTAQLETDRRYLAAAQDFDILTTKLEAQKDRQKRLERDLTILSRHITVFLETDSNSRRTNNLEWRMQQATGAGQGSQSWNGSGGGDG